MSDLSTLALARDLSAHDLGDAELPRTLGELMRLLPDRDADTHEEAVASIEAARLRRRVRELPALERRVIVARYGLIEPALSARETAARLGLTRAGVAAIERRALDRLRVMYELAQAA